jgi:hypothetical protein
LNLEIYPEAISLSKLGSESSKHHKDRAVVEVTKPDGKMGNTFSSKSKPEYPDQ